MSELMDTLCRYVNNDDDLPPDILAEVIEQLGFLKHDFEVLRAENKRLKDAQRWIPVSVRLPVIDDGKWQMVLASWGDDEVGEADVYFREDGAFFMRGDKVVEPYAWRPLPAAPEAE